MPRRSFTRVLGGGVGQVEATSAAMGPAHELDGHLVAGGLNQLLDLRAQPAVLHCNTGGTEKSSAKRKWTLLPRGTLISHSHTVSLGCQKDRTVDTVDSGDD
ncbi:hypothetical protein EYF80_035749 [Liparis tanakae]|uniref:Uncharacterized protein n=1 Tax=Liparis tanakae TaxID=230148 RepID=A0A4Z2GKF1_9TELE|nr:hypothetical protein EYF80_035749 [Liparis tanakae]